MQTQYECLAITRWPKTLRPWEGKLSVSDSTVAYRGALHQEISPEQAISWEMLMGTPEYNEMISAGNLIIKSYTVQKTTNEWTESLVAHISLMLADFYHEQEGKVFLTNFEIENTERTIVSQATRRTSGPCFYLDRYDEDKLHLWIQSQSRATSRWPVIHERLFRLLSKMSENESNQVTEAITSFIEAHKAYNLSYKIPLLVRSFECLADCWSEKEFIQAVQKFTPSPLTEMPKSYTFSEEYLKRLYQFRNKLTHGHTFNQAAADLKLELHKAQSQMEFLAEYIARESIVKALLEFEAQPVFQSRLELQKYWKALLGK